MDYPPQEVVHLVRRLSREELPSGHRRWIGNDANHRNHNGRVPEDPTYVDLAWKSNRDAQVQSVGAFEIHTGALVRASYLNPDPKGGVRVMFWHGSDGVVYLGRGVKQKKIPVGHVRPDGAPSPGPTRVSFEVYGATPPKKDGAESMWGKNAEIPRLIELRKAAHKMMGRAGPFRHSIALTLNVFVPDPESRGFGDLDNLITGVCDGLMAAGAQTQLHPRWGDPEFEDVHPAKPIGILDDSSVVAISATKQRDPEGRSWYRVTLEGER